MENPNRTQKLLKNIEKLSICNNKLKKDNEKLKELLRETVDDYHNAESCIDSRYRSNMYCFPGLNSEVYKLLQIEYYRGSQIDNPEYR